MNFNQFALSKFGNYVKQHDRYLGMRRKLRSAHIFTPYEEYVSSAILISVTVAMIGLILGLLIGYFVATRLELQPMVISSEGLANFLGIFAPYKKFLLVGVIGIIFFNIIGGMVYSIFMFYPSLQASVRKVKIDTQLPHTVLYMYALSRGETNISEIIRSVAGFSSVYGEISNEFALILRDMELLGTDFMTALRNVQTDTPSENFNQFLGNLVTLIDNGGDLTEFLSMQVQNYQAKARSEHSLFLDMLGLIAEGYVTGFVAGPLFMIIVGVTLGSMQSKSMDVLLMVITYAVLPLGSIVFVVLIDTMLPKDDQSIGALNLRRVKEFIGLRTAKTQPGQEEKLFKEYEQSKKFMHIRDILKDPLHAFFEEPHLSLYVSIPAGILSILIPILLNQQIIYSGYVEASLYLTNYIILGVMVALLPYIIFYETRSRKTRNVENSIPSFLKQLSIINETGLSLMESLRVMLRTERGPLRKHVERMYTDTLWGSGMTEAFIRFANKIKTNTLSRMVALVTKANEYSGDIRDVLDIATKDAYIHLQLKKDKFTNMLIYVIIIYVAFFVFLYIVYTLTTTFLPAMAKAGGSGEQQFVKNLNLEFYKIYFYHTALVQAFFSGVIAGVLGEGNPRSGFKHSAIMLLMAFAAFQLIV